MMIAAYNAFRSFIVGMEYSFAGRFDWVGALTFRNVIALLVLPHEKRKQDAALATIEDRYRISRARIDGTLGQTQGYKRPGDVSASVARAANEYERACETETRLVEWNEYLDWFEGVPAARRYLLHAGADLVGIRHRVSVTLLEYMFISPSYEDRGEAQSQQ